MYDLNISCSVGNVLRNFPRADNLSAEEYWALTQILTFIVKIEKDTPSAKPFHQYREQYSLSSEKLPLNIEFLLKCVGVSVEYGANYNYLVWDGGGLGQRFYYEYF